MQAFDTNSTLLRNEPCLVLFNSQSRDSISNYGVNDSLASAAFQTHNTFIASLSSKWIKVFDKRVADSSNNASIVIATKLLYHIAIDPSDSRRFISCADSVVALWDARKTDVPVLSVDVEGIVNNVEWCRPGILSVLVKDTNYPVFARRSRRYHHGARIIPYAASSARKITQSAYLPGLGSTKS